MRTARNCCEEFAAHCAQLLESALAANGVAAARASMAALTIMDELRKHFGGQSIYFAKGARPDVEEHAAEVYSQHANGMRVSEIAELRGYTERYIYKLLGRERARLSSIRATQRKRAR
jgi:Mor family transcriptional regulator